MAATDAMSRRYDMLRSRAQGEAISQGKEEQDALKRRFASMGNLSSGAYVKQAGLSQNRAAQNAQRAREGVDLAEMGERAQLEEAERGRAFQTSERLGGQQFASEEGEKQRVYGTSEREAGQAFVAGESSKDRDFQGYWKGKELELENSKFLASLDQFAKQYGLDVDAAALNKIIAEYNMRDTTPWWQKGETLGKLGLPGMNESNALYGGDPVGTYIAGKAGVKVPQIKRPW